MYRVTIYTLDALLSQFELVCCSMFSFNCCFLTCIQISQKACKVVWYFHLFQNFPQFIVIHTVKGFGIKPKTEVDVFLKLSCFFYDPVVAGNLTSGSSAFSKSSLNIWKFSVYVLLKPGLEILSITLLTCQMSTVVQYFEHSLALSSFRIGMKSDFSSLVATAVFSKFADILRVAL